jgi:hypothetical protein
MLVNGAVLRRPNVTSNSRARIASSTLLTANTASEGGVVGKRVITPRGGLPVPTKTDHNLPNESNPQGQPQERALSGTCKLSAYLLFE